MEIDNYLVENATRPTVIGKKNWLFIGEAQAGQRSAVIYTIIEGCKRRGLVFIVLPFSQQNSTYFTSTFPGSG